MSAIISGINSALAADIEWVKALGPIVVGILAILVGLVANIILLVNQRRQNNYQNEANKRQFLLAKLKEERDTIIHKLNSFYGPFKELRTESRILYSKLSMNLAGEYKLFKRRRSRTLKYLLEGHHYSDQDIEIIKQILLINQELLNLIKFQMGVVDKPQLQELLGKLGAHIRILQLAFDRKLAGPAKSFEDIVFPLAIDGAIESAIFRHQQKLTDIERTLSEESISEKLFSKDKTIEYYNLHSEEYAGATLFLNLSNFYERFLKLIPLGGKILDAGCGVGRDTRFFTENGYAVVAFDASEKMVEKCREYPHAICLKLSFSEVDFTEQFDGVWACASLVHLNKLQAQKVMSSLITALKPEGVLYFSVKKDKGNEPTNGRYFEYYDDNNVSELYNFDSRVELRDQWNTDSVSLDKSGTFEWINIILIRKSMQIESEE